MSARIPVAWAPREAPLSPRGCLARGDAAVALADKVLARGREDLRITAAEDVLLIVGDDLPWVDGAVYVAPSPEEPRLWVPTHLRPTFPCSWVYRSLGVDEPVAVWPGQGLALTLSWLRRLHPPVLERWRTDHA